MIDPIASSGYGRIIAEGSSVASPQVFNNNHSVLYMYGYGMDTSVSITAIRSYDNFAKHLHQIVHPSGGPMRYYVDGILCWTRTATQNSTGTNFGYFANRSDMSRGIDADYFTVRRYNRALMEEELATNRAIDVERFNML